MRAYTTTTAVWIRPCSPISSASSSTRWNGSRSRKGTWPACRIRRTVQPRRRRQRPDGDAARRRHRCGHRRSGSGRTAICPVVPDPEATFARGSRGMARDTSTTSIVVRESLADDGEAMRELFGLFRESRELAGDCGRSRRQRRLGSRRTAGTSRWRSRSPTRRVCWRGRSRSTISSPTSWHRFSNRSQKDHVQ